MCAPPHLRRPFIAGAKASVVAMVRCWRVSCGAQARHDALLLLPASVCECVELLMMCCSRARSPFAPRDHETRTHVCKRSCAVCCVPPEGEMCDDDVCSRRWLFVCTRACNVWNIVSVAMMCVCFVRHARAPHMRTHMRPCGSPKCEAGCANARASLYKSMRMPRTARYFVIICSNGNTRTLFEVLHKSHYSPYLSLSGSSKTACVLLPRSRLIIIL